MLSAAALFGLAALLLAGAASAQDDPPGSGEWRVSTPTTVSGGTYTISGNVVVLPGASLTLNNVNLRIASPSPGQYGLFVQAGSTLSVTGGSIAATNALNTYKFEIYGPTTIQNVAVQNMWGSATVDRFGIQIYNGNTTIENSTIQLGQRGNILVASGSPTIRNNVIQLSAYALVDEAPGTCQTYLTYEGVGILVTNNSAPLIEGNTIRDNADPNGYFDPWQYYMDNYYVQASCWNNQYYLYQFFLGDGVDVSGASVEMFNNSITGNSRTPYYYAQRSYNGSVVYSYRYAEDWRTTSAPGGGLKLQGASGNITDNFIDRNGAAGVVGDGSTALMERNYISNHTGSSNTQGVGVAVVGGVRMGNSTIVGNTQGISLMGSGTGSFESISFPSGPSAGTPVVIDYSGSGVINVYNTSFLGFATGVNHQSQSGAVVNLYNCTIDQGQILTQAWGSGWVYLYWSLVAHVQWSNGAPASSAFAIITNQSQGVIYADVVGADGTSAFLWIAGVIVSFNNGGSTTTANNPLAIKVFANGTISPPQSFVFNSSVEIIVTIVDPIPPILNVFSPTAGQLFGTNSILVEGNAFDVGSGMDRVEVSTDDGATWQPSTSPLPGWAVVLALPDGTHDILVRALDNGGGLTEVAITDLVVDTVAPHIVVTQPALPQGGDKVVYTNATGVVLRGGLEDDSTFTVNGAFVPFSGGGFAKQLVLVEGPNFFHLVAVDEVGNHDELDFVIVSDTIRPSVYISAPVDNFATNRSILTVAGVTESDVTLTLNGASVPTTGGVFSLTYALSEGVNILTITAADRAGNVNAFSRTVLFDTVSPELAVLSPINNLVTNTRDIVVQGTVEAAIATVYLNGAPLSTSQGQFSKVVRLDEGPNVFVLQAWDAAGNTVTSSVTATLDTEPPVLELTAPADGVLVNTNGVRVRGTFEDAASVFIDGSPIDTAAGELDEQVGLAEGANEIVVVAVDAAGNRAVAFVTVYRDTVAPELTVNLPSTPLRTTNSLVEVHGRALGATTLRINNELVALDAGGNFTIVLPLKMGQNEITFLARDEAGNTQSLLSVVSRTLPPEEPQGLFGLGDLSYALLPAFLILGAAVAYFVVRGRRPTE